MKAGVLQEIMALNLTAEQLAGVVSILARELAPLEKIRESAAQRQAKKRDSHVMPSRDNHCESHVTVTPLARVEYNNNLPNLEGLDITPLVPPSKPKPSEHPDFEAFMAVYPKRAGNVDRKGAAKAFTPALKRTDLQTLLAGARAYAADCLQRGKVGTEYVKQARSWLNGDLWTEWASKDATAQPLTASGVYVKFGTPAGDAWDDYTLKTKGKRATRDSRGGWWFPSEYPPSSEARAA